MEQFVVGSILGPDVSLSLWSMRTQHSVVMSTTLFSRRFDEDMCMMLLWKIPLCIKFYILDMSTLVQSLCLQGLIVATGCMGVSHNLPKLLCLGNKIK